MMLKIKQFAVVIAFFLCPILLFSQQPKIIWGKENPMKLGKGLVNILVKKGDNLLGYNQEGSKVNIVRYSIQDMQVKGEYPLIGKSKDGAKTIDRSYSFEGFIILKNKLYVTISKYDKGADLNSFYAQELDNQGKLTGSPKKLADISAKRRGNSGSFNFYTSEDSTKILICENPPFDKYAGEKFEYTEFNENLEEIHKLKVELPYKDRNFTAEDYVLGNDGTIFLLAKVDLERKEKQKGESGYYYEIVAINPNNKGELTEYEVKLDKKYITDLSFSLDAAQEKIICSGFYNKIEGKLFSPDDINGVYYMRINKRTKEVEASGVKDFDKEFVAELTGQRKANKGRGIAGTFLLKEFFYKKDGGAMLVAENSYMYQTTHCTTDPKTGAQHCTTTYHYIRNNIIVINIDPAGSIKWYANIPKYQHTRNDKGTYSSFMCMSNLEKGGDKLYFIYNDNPKNLDPKNVKSGKNTYTMGSPKKSTAVLVELSESGQFTKKTLFSNKEAKSILMPASSAYMGQSEQIVPSLNAGFYCCVIPIKKAKYKLARVTY